MDRPPQITTRHLERFALVYVRSASMEHVNANTGATDTQRRLADLPRQWGWPAAQIEVIDDDMGMSGSSSENRAGYQRMFKLIERRRVGLVLVRDIARLSRNPLDLERFLGAVVKADCLLCMDDRVIDLASKRFGDHG